MRLGKLTDEELKSAVLSHFVPLRNEVVLRPKPGVDCAALELGGGLCVLSTDPITSAGEKLGALAVHVSCNDAVAAGAEPVGLMVTLLLPPDASLADIERFAKELGEEARKINVEIIGGHTEFTDSVTRMVSVVTVVAKAAPGALITPEGMKAGDSLIMTKWAGLEGTAVIASDFAEKLPGISPETLQSACGLFSYISVLPEGRIAARRKAHALHDVTEGGVIAAVCEMAQASGCKVMLDETAIPVLDCTREITGALNIDPLRLLSSGCLLIACHDVKGMLLALREGGVMAAKIGVAVQGNGVFLKDGTQVYASAKDEIYRV